MGLYRQLFIFIEGDEDELFFSRIIEPMFRGKYNSVEVHKWAQEKRGKVDNYIKSVKSENWNADYIFVTDMDAPCVTAQKEKIQKRCRNVDKDKIMVVKKEVESWYLAGLDDDKCMDYGIPFYSTTDAVTKEQFNGLIPRQFGSEIDFKQEVLKFFDIETAKQKNKSFRYFVEKYDP